MVDKILQNAIIFDRYKTTFANITISPPSPHNKYAVSVYITYSDKDYQWRIQEQNCSHLLSSFTNIEFIVE